MNTKKRRLPRALIVMLAGDGATNAQIAAAAGITVRTLDRDRAADPELNAAIKTARAAHTAKLLRPCGTVAAYHRHLHHGEPVDDACRAAKTEYTYRLRMKRRQRAGLGAPDPDHWAVRRREQGWTTPRPSMRERIEQAIARGDTTSQIITRLGCDYATVRAARHWLDQVGAA